MSNRPIAKVRLPAHHPVVAETKDGEHVMAKLMKVPKPKMEHELMPKGMSEGDRPMDLEHDFHVMDISRPPAPKAASNPMGYLKSEQAKRAKE